ncbi:MAG TPA: tRNA glutamyl-Q(34) synthetase GluQRS [Gammaproteobacteria bacterium]|nr:tRNA glutamyl-Q(34) synthetase GluQRS [Gammaproteobacteria bacterium]
MAIPSPPDARSEATPYRGRFAPSPTGPLHFGSLIAAVASYLDARSHGGQWYVRMEDVDRPREMPGAADSILRSLDTLGLHWDGPVLYQSRRQAAYDAALEQLAADGAIYPCACTRREIADGAVAGPSGVIYPGTCRNGLPPGRRARALRARVPAQRIGFEDRLQGHCSQQLATEVGDFVVRRADGLVAYQLAVVVDDADQRITTVVRGSDLLDSTPRQIHLQRLLGLPTPAYLHLPVAVDTNGDKLSKQTGAPGIEGHEPLELLLNTLHFLRQEAPATLLEGNCEALWQWAIAHWNPRRIPATMTLPHSHDIE